MHQELYIAILAGLGAMLAWGFSDFFAKKALSRIGNYPTLFWSQLIGAVPLALVTFTIGNIPTLKNGDVAVILGLGLLETVSWLFAYQGFAKGKVGLLSPIFSTTFALAVLISATVFAETIPPLRWLAFVVVLVGIFLATFDTKNLRGITLRKIKGLPEIIVATIQYAFLIAILGHFINGKSWFFYILLMRLVTVALTAIVCKAKSESLRVKGDYIWRYLILIGLFDVGAYSLVSMGFSQTTLVSVVAMISGAFPLPTIILARFFLKEKMSAAQTIGCLIIVFGIIIVSIQ